MEVAAAAVIDRWFDVLTGNEKRLIGTGHSTNVRATETALYSYGFHFPLAEPLRDEEGFLHTWVLNGDRYSSTTTGHQGNPQPGEAHGQAVPPHPVLRAQRGANPA